MAWVQKCPGGGVNLWVARAHTGSDGLLSLSGTRNITSFFGGGSDRWPQFSPNGQELAFMRIQGGYNFDIWRADLVADADGLPQLANPVRVIGLGGGEVEDCCVSWSPDGSSLVWASNVNKGALSFDLFRVDKNTVNVTDAVANLDGSPDGSVDPAVATRLVTGPEYTGTPAYDDDGTVLYRCNCPNPDIYRLAPQTGTITRLTTHLGLDRTPEGFPGGILYSRNNNGNDEIYRAGYNGQSPTNLTNATASDRDPTWLPPEGGGGTLPPPPPPAEDEAPTVSLAQPLNGSTSASTLTISGRADDDFGISTVEVAVRRNSDNAWLQPDGSFAAFRWIAAEIEEDGTGATFTYSVPLATGSYGLMARAIDSGGSISPKSSWVNTTISGGGGGSEPPPREDGAPTVSVAQPVFGSTSASPLAIAGRADDDRGITDVQVAVRRASDGRWLQPDGSFGAFRWVSAQIVPDGTGATFNYSVPVASGTYGLMARAIDSGGNLSPKSAWVNTTIQ